MFRRWSTILGPKDLKITGDPMDVAKLDADVIMTAAVLGFTAGQIAAGHPVEFVIAEEDANPKSEKYDQQKVKDLRRAVDRINHALAGYRVNGTAKVGKPVPWEPGAMITGASGAAAVPFEQRHARVFDENTVTLRGLASAGGDEAIGYQGVGAYTGLRDDPIDHRPGVQSTTRYNVPDEGYGERWVPPTYHYNEKRAERELPWGLIKGDPHIETMQQRPFTMDPAKGNLVGYTHGMVQSIYGAVQSGPWCTPFELAVGEQTCKMASCFTCTLFMYATGFSPSAIHLGRGESWVPFYEKRPAKESGVLAQVIATFSTPAGTSNQYVPLLDMVIETLNNRWRIECDQYLRLGISVMRHDGMANVSEAHRPRLDQLEAFLEARSADVSAAANLILDAVTVPDQEMARINRTLAHSADVTEDDSTDGRRLIRVDSDENLLGRSAKDGKDRKNKEREPLLLDTES
jgi:hypothetical protein